MTERLLCAFMLAVAATVAQPPLAVAQDETCSADGQMQFLCGIQSAEDILQLGDSKWLIAGGMGVRDMGGALHLIDGDAKSWQVLYPGETPAADPDAEKYAQCTEPPDPESFVAHGLSLRKLSEDEHELLAINHGREAVEVFSLKATENAPEITWKGCVTMPDGTYTNSVAALPDGGFVATKMFDPTKENPFADIMAGKITGLVYEWRPDSGFSVVAGSTMSGPNGIEVSPDGSEIYVAAFGSRELVRMSRGGSAPERESVKVNFMVDNLRWTDDGKLLVAGSKPASGELCDGDPCPSGWRVLAWDPESMSTQAVLDYSGESPLTGVSVATKALDHYWIGSFTDDQVGYIPVN